ncbi:MAG: SpoIIE family protein phosphatase [Desulfobacterales bacterium]|nr:SpoIIE family protein phosphatase [Desulfobacterales bacterium]
MSLLPALKLRLGTKIVSIVLGLPFICVILFGTISYVNMINLGSYASESIYGIGSNVSECSKKSLQNNTRKYLTDINSHQAAFSDGMFRKVMSETERMAAAAGELWSRPWGVYSKGSYSYRVKPRSIYSASAYKLAPGVDEKEVKGELDLSTGLDPLFMSVLASIGNLAFVYVGTQSGFLRIYPWSGDFEPPYDPRKRGWYKRAIETGRLGWSEPYMDAGGKDLMITCSKPFYDSTGRIIGVMGADVTLASIVEKIINTHVGDLGYALLMDEKGNVIARPGLESGDHRWDESFSTENLMHSTNPGFRAIAEEMTEGKKGIGICRFGDADKYIAYAPLPSTKWSVAVIVPFEEVLSPIKENNKAIAGITQNINREIGGHIEKGQWMFLLVFFTMAIIIVFFGVRLSRAITKPILALNRGSKIIGGGNLDHRLEIKTGDEIEDLANTLNKMSQDLKAYMEKVNQDIAHKERIEQARLIFSGLNEAIDGTYSFDWMVPHMVRERHQKGEILFRKGDQSDKLYYIIEGLIHLPEINKNISSGQILGEMGLFRASRERTLSALCETDLEVNSITHKKLFDLYYQDPTVGFRLSQVVTQRLIENLKAETKEKERIESELRIAREIQGNALPSTFPPFPDRKEIDIFASMVPAKEVGGDLYDFFFIDEDHLCFIIGDVSGKGVPAALFMMTTKTLLKTETLRGLPLEKVLYDVNNIIASENKTAMFITLFCAVLNTKTGEVEYANAGHNRPLVCRQGSEFEYFFPKANFVLGPMEDMTFTSEKLELRPDETIFIYTDGVTEAMNDREEFYSEERLRKTLTCLKDQNVEGMLKGISKDLEKFVQFAPQYDDITMLAVKFNG